MTEGGDQPKLKVDRLARAMAVARTRAAEPVEAGPGTGAAVAAGNGTVPGAAMAAEMTRTPDSTAAAAPLILTADLMRAPPAAATLPAEPAAPPAAREPAPAILRQRPLPDAAAGAQPGPAPLPRFGPPFLSLSGVRIEDAAQAPVGFDVPAGGVTVLLAAPGAQASALLRAIMGVEPPVAGRLRLDGQDVTGWPPRRLARAGIGYLPGDLGLFPGLSVAENLRLGALSGRLPRDRLDAVFRLFPALKPVWHWPARELDRAGAQMVALARLMAERRRLYLVDTVAMTADAVVPPALLAALRELKLQGATVLLAAQSLSLAAGLGDTCVALAGGQVVWTGPMAVIAEDAELRARCLGPGKGAP